MVGTKAVAKVMAKPFWKPDHPIFQKSWFSSLFTCPKIVCNSSHAKLSNFGTPLKYLTLLELKKSQVFTCFSFQNTDILPGFQIATLFIFSGCGALESVHWRLRPSNRASQETISRNSRRTFGGSFVESWKGSRVGRIHRKKVSPRRTSWSWGKGKKSKFVLLINTSQLTILLQLTSLNYTVGIWIPN